MRDILESFEDFFGLIKFEFIIFYKKTLQVNEIETHYDLFILYK
jgi:hypothetical protein